MGSLYALKGLPNRRGEAHHHSAKEGGRGGAKERRRGRWSRAKDDAKNGPRRIPHLVCLAGASGTGSYRGWGGPIGLGHQEATRTERGLGGG